jgi:hypothetical protein
MISSSTSPSKSGCRQLSPAVWDALDALILTDAPEDDAGQPPLFPVKSDLATLKDGAGAIKVVTVRQEIEKLQQLRALGLPDMLFEGVPVKVATHYRQRASTEPPRELRRHPPHVRYTLLAALCWQRQREITDTLVELLPHIAHHRQLASAPIGCRFLCSQAVTPTAHVHPKSIHMTLVHIGCC